MKRTYTAAQYREVVGWARRHVRDVEITSDFIVGFPGETDADFAATRALVEEIGFVQAYVFKYSVRPNTLAARRLEDDVPEETKRARNLALLEAQDVISEAANRALLGTTVEVLLDEVSKTDASRLSGRTPGNRIVHVGADATPRRAPRARARDRRHGALAPRRPRRGRGRPGPLGRPLTSAGDRALLLEAAALAERGRFRVEPNPLVGRDPRRAGGRVVGRGWHRGLRRSARRGRGPPRGGPARARRDRLRHPRAVQHPREDAPVRRGPRARGRGARRLRRARPESRPRRPRPPARSAPPASGSTARSASGPPGRSSTPSVAGSRAGRPWVVAKWAMSMDGRTSPAEGAGGALSGARAGRLVHDLRGRVEAVAVGIGTVLADDPRLTCRRPGGPPHGRPQPLAVVFDSDLRTPIDARVVRESSPARPLLLFTARPRTTKASALAALPGVVVIPAEGRDGRVDLPLALRRLHEIGVRRLLLEGGGTLAGAFLRAGLRGPGGGARRPAAPRGEGRAAPARRPRASTTSATRPASTRCASDAWATTSGSTPSSPRRCKS